jgi:hypothetical protein
VLAGIVVLPIIEVFNVLTSLESINHLFLVKISVSPQKAKMESLVLRVVEHKHHDLLVLVVSINLSTYTGIAIHSMVFILDGNEIVLTNLTSAIFSFHHENKPVRHGVFNLDVFKFLDYIRVDGLGSYHTPKRVGHLIAFPCLLEVLSLIVIRVAVQDLCFGLLVVIRLPAVAVGWHTADDEFFKHRVRCVLINTLSSCLFLVSKNLRVFCLVHL